MTQFLLSNPNHKLGKLVKHNEEDEINLASLLTFSFCSQHALSVLPSFKNKLAAFASWNKANVHLSSPEIADVK